MRGWNVLFELIAVGDVTPLLATPALQLVEHQAATIIRRRTVKTGSKVLSSEQGHPSRCLHVPLAPLAFMAFLLGGILAIEGSHQPSPHTIGSTSSSILLMDSPCKQYEADLIRLLAQPRGRDAKTSRNISLFNWNRPDFAPARRAAAAAATSGCPPQPLGAHLHNIKLVVTPCLTQCLHPMTAAADERVARCYNRACNATIVQPAWEALAFECGLTLTSQEESPLQPWLHEGVCEPLGRVWRRAVQGAGRIGDHIDKLSEFYSEYVDERGGQGSSDNLISWRALSSAGEHCRTMFDEICCPEFEGRVCGGAARGECLPVSLHR